jgi:hypothetical protein
MGWWMLRFPLPVSKAHPVDSHSRNLQEAIDLTEDPVSACNGEKELAPHVVDAENTSSCRPRCQDLLF